MEVKKGMIFRGNINRVCFEILDANEKIVKYAVLLENNRLSEKRIFSDGKPLSVATLKEYKLTPWGV